MDSDTKELISVLLTMGILFIVALIAVAIFIRQWYREKKDKDQTPRP